MNSTQHSAPSSWGDPRKGKGTTAEPKLVLKRSTKIVRFPTGNPFYSLEEEEPLGEMSSQSAHTAATA